MAKFEKFTADYNLIAPEDMDALLYSPFEVALGEQTVLRLQRQFDNYEYYEGKQHRNANGELVEASELERPSGLEYDPTRYATNYFKTIINRKARWQMGGRHSFVVPRKKIIDEEGVVIEDQQLEADAVAEGYEKLLHQLWRENKMRAKLLQAARDRLIADRVVAKIVYNPNNGKLRWIFRPDTEFFPVYSDDDFEELIACHFIRQMIVTVDDEDVEAFRKQTFTLEGEGDSLQCYVEEAIYTAEDLELFEQILPRTPMNLDFIPIVTFEVSDLLAENASDSEIANLREQNDVLNRMNEDAIDALRFEMFAMTAVINAPEGTAEAMQIAPGAVLEARGYTDGNSPSIQRIESGFKWGGVFKDQYMRVKGAMHEISALPQVVPQELNFGGLNTDALQILFQDIIADTEEHWLSWEYGFQELHEKSVRYLQARLGEAKFAYDKEVVRKIEDYETEMRFVLPLPDNRKELVELLTDEMNAQLESQSGALSRLGVEDVDAKREEIRQELAEMQAVLDPYADTDMPVSDEDDTKPAPGPLTPQAQKAEEELEKGGTPRNAKGEAVEKCGECGGSGNVISTVNSEIVMCQNCRGDGVVQVRKR